MKFFKFWRKIRPGQPIVPAPIVHENEDQLINPFETTSSEQPTVSIQASNEQPDPELAAGGVRLKKHALLSVLQQHSTQLIIFQAGSFGLRAALVQQTQGRIITNTIVHSRCVDFTRAIADIITQLKACQTRLPKRAILLTPSVVSTIIDLPVSPLRPRSDEQMQELIRWEIEGAVTLQNQHWMIGSMLIERGYLSSAQRADVLEALKSQHPREGQPLQRFGDFAIQLGLITQEQLDECLILQGKLVAVDDDFTYSWRSAETERNGLSDEILLSQEEDSESSHPWLVSGLSKTVRRRWVGAFNLNNIHLEAFYPVLGSAFASLPLEHNVSEQWLLEIHQEQLLLMSGTHKAISYFQTAERHSESQPSLDDYIDLLNQLPADTKRLFLNTTSQTDITHLSQQLTDTFHLKTQTITADTTLDNNSSYFQGALPSLIGAARHYLQLIPASRISPIKALEHKEPTWRKLLKPRNLALIGAVSIIITMFGFLGWLYLNTQAQTERLHKLDERYDRELKLKQKLESIHSENLQIKDDLANIKQETQTTQTLLHRLSLDHSHRSVNLAPLLKAISLGLTANIAVVSIEKKQDHVTLLTEVSDPALGQEYVDTLTQLIRPVYYRVSNSVLLNPDAEGHQFEVQLEFKPSLPNPLLISEKLKDTSTTQAIDHVSVKE